MKFIDRSALADRLYQRRCKVSRPALSKWEAKARESVRQRIPMYDNMKARR